jgi:hypothetical protein
MILSLVVEIYFLVFSNGGKARASIKVGNSSGVKPAADRPSTPADGESSTVPPTDANAVRALTKLPSDWIPGINKSPSADSPTFVTTITGATTGSKRVPAIITNRQATTSPVFLFLSILF